MVYILIVIGFICLVKGADFFVSGSSAIARYFNIPTFIIGLTIVAFGTSLPEAAVSITAALRGANGIAVGNVIGSNIFNLLVVLGFSALIKTCPVTKSALRFEYPLSIIAVAVLIFLLSGIGDASLTLSRIDGIILALIFIFFMTMTLKNMLKSRNEAADTDLDMVDDDEKTMSLPRGSILSVIGVLGIIFGGDLVVDSATSIARSFGIDETLIGLTIVALGTSLPELVTSIVAATKGETDIAVGNVIGSNLFNILFVLSASVIIKPIEVNIFSLYDATILAAISLVAYIPMLRKKSITRSWGILFLAMYVLYMFYIITRSF